ncbi:MAG: carbamate kinase [Erysipelotrichaceae bacterium]|nr:carbamate kinase [Erysipelotrichaceae bacterium]
MAKIVIALGGNALGNDLKEQDSALTHSAHIIASLINQGHDVLITHGNGPQVGKIHQVMNTQLEIPLYVSVAMSQGYIGFDLTRKLHHALSSLGINVPVDYVLTMVEVDADDPAFQHPTKPIGGFMDEATAAVLMKEGIAVVEDSGRGYRRVVASPKPKHITNLVSIQDALKQHHVVVCAGGGGIPVVTSKEGYIGVEAVIDKDSASALLAKELDVDVLFILTAVEKVAVNYGTPQQQWLSNMSIEETKRFISEGHFAPGSMLPKVEAALSFVSGAKNKTTIITLLDKASEALKGETGTRIVSD